MKWIERETDRRSAAHKPLDKSPQRIAAMFDAIAGRYDLLNRILSIGFDQRWRARAVNSVNLKGGESVIDLCTGTGDLALTVAISDSDCHVIGVDFSVEMLRHGNEKICRAGVSGQVKLIRGDVMQLPICDETVDVATIGFGIRNVREPVYALQEIRRVLRPGGRLAIVEFGYPRAAVLRAAYLWYFRQVLPVIGRVISRHYSAYSYLPASVGDFWEPELFRRVLAAVGFVNVRAIPLTFGVVYLYEARKQG